MDADLLAIFVLAFGAKPGLVVRTVKDCLLGNIYGRAAHPRDRFHMLAEVPAFLPNLWVHSALHLLSDI
jgi:hypothetical protein